MKLIAHAGLFSLGAIRLDTETGEWAFLTTPLINSDISVLSENGERVNQGGRRGQGG